MSFTIHHPITCVVLVDFKVIAYGVPPLKMFRKKTKQRERLQMAFNGSGKNRQKSDVIP